MRLISFLTLIFLCLLYSNDALASDPDGIFEICEKRMNKYTPTTDCNCIVERYYPKKQDLSELYGVPLQSEAVLPHLQNVCHNISAMGEVEYKSCMTSPTFKRVTEGIDREAFCTCYSNEWQRELTEYKGETLDRKVRQNLKGSARAICKKKFN